MCRVTRNSTRLPPGAKQVVPSLRGESYSYVLDKFWLVMGKADSGKLRVRTRRGREFQIDPDDRRLRAATWRERAVWRHKFPPLNPPPRRPLPTITGLVRRIFLRPRSARRA